MNRKMLVLAGAALCLASIATAKEAAPSKAKTSAKASPKASPKAPAKASTTSSTTSSSSPSRTAAPKTAPERVISFSRGSLTDSRNGQTYKTVTLGNQTWMAENLNFEVDASLCYESRKQGCDELGRLYEWDGAKKACPAGWHLPSDDEWKELEAFLESPDSGGRILKSTTGWSSGGNGTDRAGFAAIPAGNSDKTGLFNNRGFSTTFWTSSKKLLGDPWFRRLHFDETGIARETSDKSYLYSVRCVKDRPKDRR